MPTFNFVARDDAGQTRTGTIEAASASVVASQLRTRGWIVVTLEEQFADLVDDADRSTLLRGLFAPRGVAVELGGGH